MGGRGASSGNTLRLPALQGSEKQVKWAEEIRKNAMPEIKAYLKMLNNKDFKETYQMWRESDREDYKRLADWYDRFQNKIVNETKAGKWIKNKETFKRIDDYAINDLRSSEIERAKIKIKEGKKKSGYNLIVRSIARRYRIDY